MANDSKFVSRGEAGSTEAKSGDAPWGGAFWEIRAALGCRPDVARCERLDKILLAAWASTRLEGLSNTVDQRFAQGIIAAIASSGTAEESEKVRSVFERRGLRLPP